MLFGTDGCKVCAYLEWVQEAYPEQDVQLCATCSHLFVPWVSNCMCDDSDEFKHRVPS